MKASSSRNRVLQIDEHLQRLLEFMQDTIPANKLVGIAEKVPIMARLLWGHNPQEPVSSVSLTCLDLADGRLLDASESDPGGVCAGGDSAEAMASR
jgi:hypothetical protein